MVTEAWLLPHASSSAQNAIAVGLGVGGCRAVIEPGTAM